MKKVLSSMLAALAFFAVTSCEEYDPNTMELEEDIPVGNVADFQAQLDDVSVTEIILPYGVYEGVFMHTKGPKTIKAVDPEKPAVIRGKIGVTAEVAFENILFDYHKEYSNANTENSHLDRYQRKSIVPIYAAKASFKKCAFTNIYKGNDVAAINYGAHKSGSTAEKLAIDSCYFQGGAYVIYSRALISVTNSAFNQEHPEANPRAIFLYGLGDGTQGTVEFKNNKAIGEQPCYTMQMMSANYNYRKIHYDVQGNENFSVNGEAYLPTLDGTRDFSETTFAPGSETFDFDLSGKEVVPTGDVEAFKAQLADPSVSEIVLPYGIYEGLFMHTVGPKTIKSANPEKQAIIKGKVGVTADVRFENITFDVHDEYSLANTGVDGIDRKERKAIVAIASAKASFEGCNFYNLYDSRVVVAINYGEFSTSAPDQLEVNNCYFEGYAYAIYSRAFITVTNSTFKQNHNSENPRAIFLYGADGVNQGSVVFKNNTAAGKESYTMQMSSTTYSPSYKKIHYDVQGNTNFSVNGEAYLPRLDGVCDFTGTTFANGSETFDFGAEEGVVPTGDVEAFKAQLADPSVSEIVLPYGIYEGLFMHTVGPKTIKSANPEKQAIIKGKVGVTADVRFENITFDVHDEYSLANTGVDGIDRKERKAIVAIASAKASFEGCNFYNLYDSRVVVAINYGEFSTSAPDQLEVNNCYFEGYAYAIYSRAFITVTNSTFKQNHNSENPRAIFLYGADGVNQGSVVFKNNTAAGKESYTMQMSSTTYSPSYKKIHYDVQGNTNFSVNGEAYLPRLDGVCDFTGTTFAKGSETFDFGAEEEEVVPAGDVAAFKAQLADASVTEIVLPYGLYEGVFVHNKGTKTIKSENPAKPAVIKGKIGVSSTVTFENIKFDVHETYSLENTGHQYLDKYQRKAIVPVYAAKATFKGCTFVNIYESDTWVAAINYGAHKAGTIMEIDNCSFQGGAYAIYSRALVSVTNSTFDLTYPDTNPRAIFLYGLGDGNKGSVVFKNNTATNKTSYTMQMMSANYDYKNINYDVQGNKNFDVNGAAFLPKVDGTIDFTGTTFSHGSMTFDF